MTCPRATFFHRSAWQRILQQSFGHQGYFLYAQVDERIVGVLPLAHVRNRLFGNALVGLPFAVYGGVSAESPEAAAALEQESHALAQRPKVPHRELRNVQRRHDDRPLPDLYVTFRKEILPEEEANMLAIPR